MKKITPPKTKLAMRLARTAPSKRRMRKTESLMTGLATRRSMRMKSTRSAIDPAIMAAKPAVGRVSNCTRAQDSRKRLPTSVMMPGKSIRRPACTSRVSGVAHHVRSNATIPIGRLIQKIHRQFSPSTIAPPTSGPSACAPQQTAIQAAIAVSRCLPVKITAIMASAVGRMAAAPMPSSTRPMMSTSGDGARAATTDPSRMRPVPIVKSSLRP